MECPCSAQKRTYGGVGALAEGCTEPEVVGAGHGRPCAGFGTSTGVCKAVSIGKAFWREIGGYRVGAGGREGTLGDKGRLVGRVCQHCRRISTQISQRRCRRALVLAVDGVHAWEQRQAAPTQRPNNDTLIGCILHMPKRNEKQLRAREQTSTTQQDRRQNDNKKCISPKFMKIYRTSSENQK